jgi:GMP synthase (glutamine-hydrolysing)
MRIHYLQHVPFEGLGSIESWALARGHTISRTRLFQGEPCPDIGDIDWLIVMGGPMSVNDTDEHTWLITEKRFVGQAIEAGKTVLGICLGAQLIASVLGANVYPQGHKEIGWFEVEKVATAAAAKIGAILSEKILAFHWHGETFELPAGAVHLARSKACHTQAFACGDRVVGLQYHLETTRASANALIENCTDELVDGSYIQSAAEMLVEPSRFDTINREMKRLLEYLAG